MRWMVRELGRSLGLLVMRYAGTRQNSQGLANGAREVGLPDSTLNLGKPSTWGSGQQWNAFLGTIQVNIQRLVL